MTYKLQMELKLINEYFIHSFTTQQHHHNLTGFIISQNAIYFYQLFLLAWF